MADITGMDMEEILRKKLRKNAAKYPVDKSYGKSDKYTEL
jgi:hypothetical protein